MSDLLNQIYQDLREFRRENHDAVGNLKDRVAEIAQEQSLMKKDIEQMKDHDEVQNVLLDKHIAGVELARSEIARNREELILMLQTEKQALLERIEDLEAPRKWLKGAKWLVIVAGSIGAALVGIFEAYYWYKQLRP
jgi:hypothetical protein